MDSALLIWINNGWSHPLLNNLFSWLSDPLYFSMPLLVLTGFWLVWRFRLDGLWSWLILILVIGCGDSLGGLLKSLFSHPRPEAIMCELIIRPGLMDTPCGNSLNGFPSNHALNFFLTATFLAISVRRMWLSISFYAIAVLVGLSRIYLGKHFPYQVAAGAATGTLLGVTFTLIALQYLPFMKRIHQGIRQHGK